LTSIGRKITASATSTAAPTRRCFSRGSIMPGGCGGRPANYTPGALPLPLTGGQQLQRDGRGMERSEHQDAVTGGAIEQRGVQRRAHVGVLGGIFRRDRLQLQGKR